MKKCSLLALAVLLVGLSAFAYSGFAQANAVTPQPTSPTAPGTQHVARPRHPAIRRAIEALERAKADMQAAAHDFGGHRVDALAACDNAIAQLKLALQYANQNEPASPTNP
jgi:hypothetical protein